MTKCQAFWRIIGLFKEGKMHVKIDGKKLTGFEGFKEWCGGKSYSQARREWNTYETLELIGKKLNVEPCAVLNEMGLTAKSLEPLISLRNRKPLVGTGGRKKGSVSLPSDIQEQVIDKLIPRLLTRKIKPQEIRELVYEFKPSRERYKPKVVKEKETNKSSEFDKTGLTNSILEILGIINKLPVVPEPYSKLILSIKESVGKLLDLLEEEK